MAHIYITGALGLVFHGVDIRGWGALVIVPWGHNGDPLVIVR